MTSKNWILPETMIPVVLRALGKKTKRIGGKIKNIQTTAWLRLARILGRVLET